LDWRSGRIAPPRDPPFNASALHERYGDGEEDEESTYEHVPAVSERPSTYDDSNVAHAPYSDTAGAGRFRDRASDDITPPSGSPGGYASPTAPAGRPSMDAYGAFSDPAPSGFAAPGPPSPSAPPPVSRTMQYADPYAAVRATIGAPPAASGVTTPPSYEPYQGYR
jgi:hypothetical protein